LRHGAHQPGTRLEPAQPGSTRHREHVPGSVVAGQVLLANLTGWLAPGPRLSSATTTHGVGAVDGSSGLAAARK